MKKAGFSSPYKIVLIVVLVEMLSLCVISVAFWMAVISEHEFYDSRTSSLHELCARRISNDGNGVTVAEAYHLPTHVAQNSTLAPGHNTHAKLAHTSSLSAPDVHQVSERLLIFNKTPMWAMAVLPSAEVKR